MAKVIVATQEEVNFKGKSGEDVKLFKIGVIKQTKKGVSYKDYFVRDKIDPKLVSNPFTDDFQVCEADLDIDDYDKVRISNIRPEEA